MRLQLQALPLRLLPPPRTPPAHQVNRRRAQEVWLHHATLRETLRERVVRQALLGANDSVLQCVAVCCSTAESPQGEGLIVIVWCSGLQASLVGCSAL